MSIRRRVVTGLAAAAAAGFVLTPAPADAQYFGRNKVQYRTFAFEVRQTDHFDIYFYDEEREAAEIVGRLAERWYARLSRFFDHELRGRQPLILYAAASHFRQTNAVEGLIGEGTGGVTEALKRRIVLPMAGTLADTDHVLGHELVHAFQFDLTGTDPRESGFAAPGILGFPLWFAEGMAEYLSLGPVDAQTAMWMRDAALAERLPHLSDLDGPPWFPYRWGHAFWAFVGARYGDRVIASLVRSAANPRFDLSGLARQLGADPDALTAEWHEAIRARAAEVAAELPEADGTARRVIGRANGGGRFNLGPRVSPDGRQVAFFSERDRFSIDLFLADVATGRVERKLVGSATDPHFDSLGFLGAAGGWSPDGRALALTAMRRGRPVVALIDPRSGRITRELALPGLDEAVTPAFAPDGRSIVLSGNRGGLHDLYRVWLASGEVVRLTADPHADLEPVFTPDGRAVVFVTERFTTDLVRLDGGPLRLGRLDLATGEVAPVPAFLAGPHLSPQVSPDGRTVTFIGAPDGIANLYRLPLEGGPVERLSAFATGVAGLAATSPALSASADGGRLVFSVFEHGGHAIYALDAADVVAHVAPPVGTLAAQLPGPRRSTGDVERLLANAGLGLPPAEERRASRPYRRGLSLDLIGPPTLTAGVSQFGTFVSGGMSAFFSDMLGDRLLGLAGHVSGDFADLGGEVVYVDRRRRWNWAAVVEQSPYRVGFLTVDRETPDRVTVREHVYRQVGRGVAGVAAYPFSQATRVEVAGGFRRMSFRRDVKAWAYDAATGELAEFTADRSPIGRPLALAEASAALVYDTAFFGATSPVYGSRARLEVGRSSGTLAYTSVLADWRRYVMPVRPVTLAVRTLHAGRYGRDAEDGQLLGYYAGYPELVRGYGFESFTPAECRTVAEGQCPTFDNLIGSRLLVANVEVRAPLVGLFRRDLEYGFVPIELAAFADAAVTWTASERPAFLGGSREVVRSLGAAVRVNAFGLLVVEVAAARPLDRPDRQWRWQVGLRQGF